MNRGGVLNHVLGGWELTWIANAPVRHAVHGQLLGQPEPLSARRFAPEHPNRRRIAPIRLTGVSGPNRFPTSAQIPYLNFEFICLPGCVHARNLGRNTFEGPGLNWTQISLAKAWRVRERTGLSFASTAITSPFKQPNFSNPGSTYNANSPGSFARITGVQGSFSNLGFGRPNYYLVGRFEF